MPKSQNHWPLRLALIVIVLFMGLTVAAGTALDSHGPRFGLTVTELTTAGTHGVVVSDVQRGSVAEEAGIRIGDVIQEVNRKAVANMADYEKAMRAVDTMVMFLINRKGEHTYIALEGPAEPAK
jgi:serine protease Do